MASITKVRILTPRRLLCIMRMQDMQEKFVNTPKPSQDAQAPHAGKVANDHNKVGGQATTQLNQGKRTPASRSDRTSHLGSSNQSTQRRG